MHFNVADLFESVVDAVPERTAVVCGDRRLSFAELDARANRFAHALAAEGVKPGEHVGLYLYNSAEFLEAMLGAFKIRAVPININYRYVEEELQFLFDNADLVALVYPRELSGRVAAVAPRVDKLRTLVALDDDPGKSPTGDGSGAERGRARDYEAFLAAASPERGFATRAGDDHYVIYTGGTTGMPRGVMWRHEDVFFAGLQGGNPGGAPIERPEELAEVARQNTDPLTFLPAAPFIHGAAQWAALIGLFGGGKLVLVPGRSFDASVAARLIEAERVNTMIMVGDAMAAPLARALEEAGRAGPLDTSSLVVIASAGAVLSDSVKEALARVLPETMILNNFGATETGHQGTMYPGSEGKGLLSFGSDGTTMVLGEDLRPLKPGSGVMGKLARRGRIPIGYYKDAEKTAATFVTIDGERWVIPGDLATIEEDGRITVFGRGSVCINSGGEKIFPEEVEAAIKAHADVVDAVVVGVPDERWGQRVAAVVQPRPGADVTLATIDAHCRTKIAGYKVPRQLRIVDQIVRHPSGKPDYRWAATVARGTAPAPPAPRPPPTTGATLSAEPSSGRTFWDVPSIPPDAAWREKRRLASALRALSGLCVTSDAPDTTLGYAADAVERIVERIAQHPTRTFQEGFSSCTTADDVARFADRSTLTGLSNPNSPPIALSMEGELAVGNVTFGAPFEGIPGHVHGGIVAAAFDQVFGYLQVKRNAGSVTSVLTVRYRRPTPLLAPLRIEARVLEVEGRTSVVAARMLSGDTVTADADGVFIALDRERMQAIFSGKHG